MSSFRLVQISDTHLSRHRPFFHHNWEVIVEELQRDPPDLIVCTGDASLDGANNPDDLAFAVRQFARLPCEVLVVPGNHDIGNSLPDVRGETEVSVERCARFAHAFGNDRFVRDIGEWRFIGVNGLILGSGFEREAEQRAWVEEQLAGAGDRTIALFMHKPIFQQTPDEHEMAQACLYPEPRRALLDLIRRSNVKLVATGHVHEVRTLELSGARLVWGPSTAFVSDAERRVPVAREPGLRRVGYLDYRFDGQDFTHAFVEPPALIAQDIGNWLTTGIGLYKHFAEAPYRGLPLDEPAPALRAAS